MNAATIQAIDIHDEIKFVSTFSNIAQLTELYKAAALGDRSPDEIMKAFNNSKYSVFAIHNEQLIGAGRAFGDEVDCAVICDLAVTPEFQGTGLGGKILEALKQKVRHHLRIILYAKPGVEDFYHKRGFRKMKTAMMCSFILPEELGRKAGFIE